MAATKSFNSFRATRRSYTAHLSTHWGRVTHICVSKLTIIGSDNGLSSRRRLAIFWTSNIVNWTLTIKLQWNLNRNFYIFIHENAFENAVWKMATTSSRPGCVNAFFHPDIVAGMILRTKSWTFGAMPSAALTLYQLMSSTSNPSLYHYTLIDDCGENLLIK